MIRSSNLVKFLNIISRSSIQQFSFYNVIKKKRYIDKMIIKVPHWTDGVQFSPSQHQELETNSMVIYRKIIVRKTQPK